MASYTAYPLEADVDTLLSASAITLRVSGAAKTELFGRLKSDVTAELERETLRQFVADSVDTTRVYDGTGLPELVVDEMVTFTGAVIVGMGSDVTYTLTDVVLASEQGRPRNRLITARGSMPAATMSTVFWQQRQIFPTGRQNIQVTGKFGYGATIPTDVWEAVAGEIAHRMLEGVLFRPTGRVAEHRQGPATVKFLLGEASATGWHGRFEGVKKRYRRPAGRRLRGMRAGMI
jgi:hypothetical protein